jgi:hypothetical protein
MSKSNRLGTFADVRQILDAALAHGGGEFECASHGAAVNWRHRAYQFRKLYAETLGPKVMSPYDALVLPRLAPDSNIVTLTIRQVAGTFRPTNPSLADGVPEMGDELFEAAAALAKKLEGEEP